MYPKQTIIQDFRLKVFAKVAERLSFSRAAKDLDISQPAVSQHISELEKQCQRPLFFRRGSFIELTPFGQELLPLVLEILKRYDDLNQRILARTETEATPILIGITSLLGQHVFPTLLALLRKQIPDLRCSMIQLESEQISQHLQEGSLDYGLTEDEDPYDGLCYELLLHDECPLVTANGSFSYLSTQDFPLVSFITENELGSTEAVISYLKHTDAYAFLPETAILDERKSGRLKIVPTDAILRKRQYFLVHKDKQKTALRQHILQIAQQHFNQNQS